MTNPECYVVYVNRHMISNFASPRKLTEIETGKHIFSDWLVIRSLLKNPPRWNMREQARWGKSRGKNKYPSTLINSTSILHKSKTV